MKIYKASYNWGAIYKFFGKSSITLFWMFSFITATLIFLGCAVGLQSRANIYIPGIYKGVGEGMNGDIIVETKFTTSSILSVKVVEHEDTLNISDAAIKKIPAAVLEAQNANVDAVTGATATSEGIKLAIQSTISQASRK
jgi:uncharacterized protein with FMN-binding domain